jgi:hypothetical protein
MMLAVAAGRGQAWGAESPPADAAPVEPAVVTSAPPAAAATPVAPKPAAAARKGAAVTHAHDQIELEATQVTGNRELPNVMYVVPWKKPDLGDFAGRPPKSLLDELLAPVDREVFQRQNRYFAALQPDAAVSGAGPAPSGAEVPQSAAPASGVVEGPVSGDVK